MPFCSNKFDLYTGPTATPADSKILPVAGIWEGWLDPAVLTFGDATTTCTYSQERVVALNVFGTHTNISTARVTKIHGTFKTGCELWAGKKATYETPHAINVVSTNAKSKIPCDFKPTTLLDLAWSAGIKSYAYLYLQHKLTSPDAFEPAQAEGMAGYPLIQVAYPYAERDPDMVAFPGGLAPESVYNRTGTMLFILDDNSELQMLGCFQNEISWNAAPEWTQMPKGALQGTQSWALNKRNNLITGNCYSLNGAVMKYFFHMEDRGSDGIHTEYYGGSTWSPVIPRTVYFLTYSDKGREFLVKFPKCAMRCTGEIPMGADNTMFAFEIDSPSAQLYVSDNLYDVAYLATDFAIV